MGRYAIRRILLIIPTLLIGSLLLAAMVRLMPGDVIDVMVSARAGNRAKSDDAKELLRAKLGLDEPFHIQYLTWVLGWPKTEGTVFKTSDGGVAWKKLGAETVEPIGHITFLSPTLGWGLGETAIFNTEDGGTLWSRQHKSDHSLNALFVLDEQNGWVVGDNGTILHTTEGGLRQPTAENRTVSSWVPQVSGTTASFTDVSFVDPENGWVVGAGGTIFHTGDGGASWKAQLSNTEADLSSLAFADGRNGWVVGEGGTILSTHDAGLTWSRVDSGIIEPLNEIAIVDARQGWIVGDNGTLLYSSDGASWTLRALDDSNQNLTALAFGNENNGMIVGEDGTVLSTTDGGTTWSKQEIVYTIRKEKTSVEVGPVTKPMNDVSMVVSGSGAIRAWVPTVETRWRWGAVGGNLGERFTLGGRAVSDEIRRSFGPSLELMILSVIFALAVAIPIGIFSALRQDTWGDYLGRTVAIGGLAIPSFYLGTLVIIIPSFYLGLVPQLIYVPLSEDPKTNLNFFLLPALVGGIPAMAEIMRMTRSMMLEVLRQDYIRTAWAKGFREGPVVIRHALKNAMIPVITLIGMLIPYQLGQLLVVERIFNIPGLGTMLIQAIDKRDFPLIQGVVLFLGVVVVVGNLMVDLIYSRLDPRIRYR